MNERPPHTPNTLFVSLAAALVGVGVGVLAGAFRLATDRLANGLDSLSIAVAEWGVLAWCVPPLAVGVLAVAALWLVQHFAFGIRFILTLASYRSGVPGGIFAPMLALGVLLGVVFDLGISEILPDLGASPGMFAIAGMAAFFAATVRAPLTGIALTIEMKGNLDLMLPLLIACLAATSTAEALGSRPIYEVLLQRTLDRDGKSAEHSSSASG